MMMNPVIQCYLSLTWNLVGAMAAFDGYWRDNAQHMWCCHCRHGGCVSLLEVGGDGVVWMEVCIKCWA